MPCMSGSSNRTKPMSWSCHSSRMSFTSAIDRLLPRARPRPHGARSARYTVAGRRPATDRRRCASAVSRRVPYAGADLGGSPAAECESRGDEMSRTAIESDRTRVLPLELGRAMPVVVRGDGVWIEDVEGRRYLDAMSGGSMAATLGFGRRDIVAAARDQAERLAFVHNERLTNPAQEQLAEELTAVAPEGFTRARFTVSGADANEMALQIARSYHVERGEPDRWQVISPAQAYHGPTMETLALTGRPGMHGPFGPYLPEHLHIPPSTWRFDPTGQAALDALDAALQQAGPGTVSAFFCEAVSAAALPAYTPPVRFWEGLAERREEHGFLVCFDEVVTGVGRTGAWFAAATTACTPDIIATAKGLGAGYAAIGAVLVRDHVYEAFANGSRRFPLGHTWDGAPLSCAVGLAGLNALRTEGLVEHVAGRGATLRDE